jgi:hypothetical protein
MELTRGLLQLCAAVAFRGRTGTLGAQKRLLWQEVLPTQCVSRELSTLDVPDVESKNQKTVSRQQLQGSVCVFYAVQTGLGSQLWCQYYCIASIQQLALMGRQMDRVCVVICVCRVGPKHPQIRVHKLSLNS